MKQIKTGRLQDLVSMLFVLFSCHLFKLLRFKSSQFLDELSSLRIIAIDQELTELIDGSLLDVHAFTNPMLLRVFQDTEVSFDIHLTFL
jgi:hypothetical protein